MAYKGRLEGVHRSNELAATVAGKWTTLGTHPFDAGWRGSGNTAVGHVANRTVVADAVRWVKRYRG